jgi:hypothetical protein
MVCQPDEAHLSWATAQNRILYSFNIADFHEIHTEWMAVGRVHAGIVLAQQRRYSTGEQIRRLTRMMSAFTAEDMTNREEFLSRW